jgi:hypothetical protein
MTTAPEPRYTERGFRDYAELVDRYGSTVTVRESSNAMTDCVWIFCKNDVHPGMHLTVDQARIVRDALTEFIDEFADDHPGQAAAPHTPKDQT